MWLVLREQETRRRCRVSLAEVQVRTACRRLHATAPPAESLAQPHHPATARGGGGWLLGCGCMASRGI